VEKLQSYFVVFPFYIWNLNKKYISLHYKNIYEFYYAIITMNPEEEAYTRLTSKGIRPSIQRMAIMEYLITHHTHPTIEDVYRDLVTRIPKLSHTTVYTTLRMLAEHHVAQMITIDEHHVCYDGIITPHVHFYCTKCGKVIDLMHEKAPHIRQRKVVDGNIVTEEQLYYKGTCAECAKNTDNNN